MKTLVFVQKHLQDNGYNFSGTLLHEGPILFIDKIKFNGKSKNLKSIFYYGLAIKDGVHFIQMINTHSVNHTSINHIKDIPAEGYILPLEDDTRLYHVAIRQGNDNTDIAMENNIRIHKEEFEELMKVLDNNEIILILKGRYSKNEGKFL